MIATTIYGVTFSVDQWALLIGVFLLTLAALYGLGMMLAGLFLMWGREAWHLTQLLVHGQILAAQQYRARMDDVEAEVRAHLRLAAEVLKDLDALRSYRRAAHVKE